MQGSTGTVGAGGGTEMVKIMQISKTCNFEIVKVHHTLCNLPVGLVKTQDLVNVSMETNYICRLCRGDLSITLAIPFIFTIII